MEVCILSFLCYGVGENCFWPSLYQSHSHSIFPPYHFLSWLLEISQFFSTHKCEVVGIVRRAGSPTVPTFPLSTNPALGKKVHGFTHPPLKGLDHFLSLYLYCDLLDYERVSHYLSKSSSFSLSFVKPFLFLMAHEPFLSNAFTLLNSCYSLPVWTVSFSRD